ncbi:MAG: M28 family peptidase [Candidatus Marinimicrobia bacterium]|nr:M28 family peptidase [Candidatus Neomarinimicrobiota bacterium]
MKLQNVYIWIVILSISFLGCAQKTTVDDLADEAISPDNLIARALNSITGENIKGHIKILSDDAMEGRAPGSKGVEMAADYIASQFTAIGLEPVVEGSYFQPFPMVGVKLHGDMSIEFEKNGKILNFKYFDESMKETGLQVPLAEVNAEVVYVGYGIQAPENDWDDYKGMDVSGKVLLMLVNDPPSEDPGMFGGKALTYYGRWTYKYEKAAELGAVGAILIHTDQSAGYGWKVIQGSWSGEQFALGLNDNSPPQLALRSWVSESSAEKLLSFAGYDLHEFQEAAAKKDFSPVELGIKVNTKIESNIRIIETKNVIGIIRGSDPLLSNEMVIWSGHYDHLGIGAPNSEGDKIYNGAWDNASGVAAILEMAKAAVGLKPILKRSILVMALTAEESGLLGSKYYSENPVFHLATAKALFNIDAINLWGETSDMIPLGFKRSTIEDFIQPIAEKNGLELKPDQSPEQGFFFRSDHFPFAKAGVPAVSVDAGNEYIGHDEEWKENTVDAWIDANYHQPSDEYSDSWDLSGSAQLAKFVLESTIAIANSAETPVWHEGQEFKAARLKSLKDYSK